MQLFLLGKPLRSKLYTVIMILDWADIFTKFCVILPYIKYVHFLKWVFQMSTLNYHCNWREVETHSPINVKTVLIWCVLILFFTYKSYGHICDWNGDKPPGVILFLNCRLSFSRESVDLVLPLSCPPLLFTCLFTGKAAYILNLSRQSKL